MNKTTISYVYIPLKHAVYDLAQRDTEAIYHRIVLINWRNIFLLGIVKEDLSWRIKIQCILNAAKESVEM